MSHLFITATGTDVGKTYVACALIRALRARQLPVDALKPVLSGVTDIEESDAGRLLEAMDRPLSDIDVISPWRFAAPLAPPSAARAEGKTIEGAALTTLCRDRLDGAERLLIEGAGGVMSPIAEGMTNLDLMAELRLPALLVTGSYLGAVSHALTALEVLKSRAVPVKGVVVSESAGESPDLSEITGALASFAPGLAVHVARRDGAFDACPIIASL